MRVKTPRQVRGIYSRRSLRGVFSRLNQLTSVDDLSGVSERLRPSFAPRRLAAARPGRVAPGGKAQHLPPYASPADNPHVPDYRRNRVPGGTYFFMVNLLERKLSLMTHRSIAGRRAANPRPASVSD